MWRSNKESVRLKFCREAIEKALEMRSNRKSAHVKQCGEDRHRSAHFVRPDSGLVESSPRFLMDQVIIILITLITLGTLIL